MNQASGDICDQQARNGLQSAYKSTSSVFCVFEAIHLYAKRDALDHLSCAMSIQCLAEKSGFSTATVRRAIKSLCERGYIKRIPHFKTSGAQCRNRYFILRQLDD
jgi:hypothetical protein